VEEIKEDGYIKLQMCSGWSQAHPSCSVQSQLKGQTRVLRALSSQVFKTAKDGNCTNSQLLFQS